MFNSIIQTIACTQNANTKILSRSSLRYGLILMPTAAIWILNKPLIAASTGILLPIASNPLFLNVKEHGSVVQEEFHAWTSTANVVLGYIEVMACDCESQELLKDALGHRVGDEDWHRRFGAKNRRNF